jgi:hypothetical protein
MYLEAEPEVKATTITGENGIRDTLDMLGIKIEGVNA